MFLNSTFFVFYIMIFLPRSSILFTNGNGTFSEWGIFELEGPKIELRTLLGGTASGREIGS